MDGSRWAAGIPIVAIFLIVGCGVDPDITTTEASSVRVGTPRFPASGPEADSAGSNIRVNQDASGQDQNETMIDVNPLDPLNLVAVAHDYRLGPNKLGYYASFDGGLTWQDGTLPEDTYEFQSDPVIAFCADGSAVAVTLSLNSDTGRGIFLYRSTDGGATWSAPATVGDFPTSVAVDKEWVSCDTTGSAYANRVYIGFRRSLLGNMRVTYSDDFGATWSPYIQVSDDTIFRAKNGIVTSVGPNGEVYAVWYDFDLAQQHLDVSTDGGDTWGTDVVVANVTPVPELQHLPRGASSLPAMDVDRTGGPHSGNVYVAWTDHGSADLDILFKRSTDGGATWSPPLRIHDDPPGLGADTFFPWIDVDPAGRVVMTFYDTRRDPGGDDYEVWATISRDGGQTFDSDFLVSEVASDSGLTGFLGDYSAVVATTDRLYPVWTDLRPGTGESDLYTDRIENAFAYDEVRNARFTDKDSMEFDTQDARFGVDLDYDVASGLLSELHADAAFDRAACLIDDLGAPPMVDVRIPAVGEAYYYLVRVDGPDGTGTYGDGTPTRPNVRDSLDGALGVCP
jgi:hypothetical protein